jgi:hypothetical protein
MQGNPEVLAQLLFGLLPWHSDRTGAPTLLRWAQEKTTIATAAAYLAASARPLSPTSCGSGRARSSLRCREVKALSSARLATSAPPADLQSACVRRAIARTGEAVVLVGAGSDRPKERSPHRALRPDARALTSTFMEGILKSLPPVLADPASSAEGVRT